jgi:plasmid replication initiation protein
METDNGEQIAVVANQIVQACYGLNVRQQKLVIMGLAQIARDDTEFFGFRIPVSDYAKQTGVELNGKAYRELAAIAHSMLREIISVRINEGDRNRREFQWVSQCDYEDGNGAVNLRFHDNLKPWLLQLRKHFTQLRVKHLLQLRSAYSIRLLERVEMQRGLNQLCWTVSLDELKEQLGIKAETYAKFGLFRANVLDVAQKELDAKSDWSFSFETIKTGRKITGVEFTLRPSHAPKVDPVRQKWKKATPEQREAVLKIARSWARYDGKKDDEILGDPVFWEHLGELFGELEEGQKSLGI